MIRRVSIDFSLALTMNRVYLFWIAKGFEKQGIEFLCFSALSRSLTKSVLREQKLLQCFDDLLFGNPTDSFINDPSLVTLDHLSTFRKPSYTRDGILAKNSI